jgi:hypothetical protein
MVILDFYIFNALVQGCQIFNKMIFWSLLWDHHRVKKIIYKVKYIAFLNGFPNMQFRLYTVSCRRLCDTPGCSLICCWFSWLHVFISIIIHLNCQRSLHCSTLEASSWTTKTNIFTYCKAEKFYPCIFMPSPGNTHSEASSLKGQDYIMCHL